MNPKTIARKNRHRRIRARMNGTEKKPRLVVYRSLKFHYAQMIDDEKGRVIVSASDRKEKKQGGKIDMAKKVGEMLAKKAKEKGIEYCIFDRNGYKYHGRVKALADGVREGGLKF